MPLALFISSCMESEECEGRDKLSRFGASYKSAKSMLCNREIHCTISYAKGASYKSAKRTKSMMRNRGIHGPISYAKGASYKSAKRTKSMSRNRGIHGTISWTKGARLINAQFTVLHKLQHSQHCSE